MIVPTIIEPTIPHNSMESLSNARKRKSEKVFFWQALSNLEVKGIVSNLYTIEIGSLRHWLHASQKFLLRAVPLISKQMVRKIMDEAASTVIGASQVIFKTRTDKAWMPSHALNNHNFLITSDFFHYTFVIFPCFLFSFCPCQLHTDYCSMYPWVLGFLYYCITLSLSMYVFITSYEALPVTKKNRISKFTSICTYRMGAFSSGVPIFVQVLRNVMWLLKSKLDTYILGCLICVGAYPDLRYHHHWNSL